MGSVDPEQPIREIDSYLRFSASYIVLLSTMYVKHMVHLEIFDITYVCAMRTVDKHKNKACM